MKKIFLPMLLLLSALNAFAQRHDSIGFRRLEPIDFLRDKQEYKGFMIMLRPEVIRGYQFDILRDNKAIENGFANPLPFSRGLRKKEDAYKVAQWIINEYEKTGHWKHTMPPHIAQGLNIELN